MSSGAKGGNRAAGQVKDGPGTRCLYSQQASMAQKLEGTHKSDEPVSKIIWNSWGGGGGCSNSDVTVKEHLQEEGGSGLVQNRLPSIPTLLPPSRCHISFEITF